MKTAGYRGSATSASSCTDAAGQCLNDAAVWRSFPGGHATAVTGSETGWHAGLAVAALRGLHGEADADEEFLYVFGTRDDEAGSPRLTLVQVDATFTARGSAVVPAYYPSSQGTLTVGVTALPSAFPVGSHLYLVWSDQNTGEVHVSVMQDWGETGGWSAWMPWFTRSAPWGVLSWPGATFAKAGPVDGRSSAHLVVSGPPGGSVGSGIWDGMLYSIAPQDLR
jgi:hypothetical protein